MNTGWLAWDPGMELSRWVSRLRSSRYERGAETIAIFGEWADSYGGNYYVHPLAHTDLLPR